MTPNEIATRISGLSPVGEGGITMPSWNQTGSFSQYSQDDLNQWDR